MKSTWTSSTNPYKLDSFNNPVFSRLVPITEKNKDFIEGCIAIDSTYNSATFHSLVAALKVKYCTSAILEVIKEMNKINSTRLSDKEMGELSIRLSSKPFDTLNALKNTLNEKSGCASIEMLFKTIAKKTSKNRHNISFATKYIFYMSEEFGCTAHTKYSKYDAKVAECLADYCDVYDIKGYLADDFKKNSSMNENKLWDMYLKKYNACLTDLINIVSKEHKFKISRNEIDHVIWYTQK